MNEKVESKEEIFYQRAYRKLPLLHISSVISFIIAILSAEFFVIISFAQITYIINNLVKDIFLWAGYDAILYKRAWIFGDFYIIGLPTKYPSFGLSLVVLILSLMIIPIINKTRFVSKPISLWVLYILILNIASSLFFLFIPNSYPYAIIKLSEIYLQMQEVIWVAVPIVLTSGLLLIPSSTLSKIGMVLGMFVYSLVFGMLRYILFLFILNEFTVLFSMTMLFIFGPLLDTVYIVAYYSFYVSRVAEKLRHHEERWMWVY